jgi:hypothetical protein
MIKQEYRNALDTLRRAYTALPWYKRFFFPRDIAAALTRNGLPAIGVGYFTADALSIITAFSNSTSIFKRFFNCLHVFSTSRLIMDYNNRPVNDMTFLDDKDRLSGLIEAPLGRIGALLGTKEIASLASASRHYRSLFGPNLAITKLLHHVVRGQQDAAEAMLRKDPQLLIKKGDVTDYSGRTFHKVSPWQCMLWALDTHHMGRMMLACVPASSEGDYIREELKTQYDEMQGGGKDLVNVGGNINPLLLTFGTIRTMFDNEDALLLWNGDFYYANKETSNVVLLTPALRGPETESNLETLKSSIARMPTKCACKSNDAEHTLIFTALGMRLKRKGLHYEREGMHYQDSRYDFGVSEAVNTFEDAYYNNLIETDQLSLAVARKQRELPAHFIHHFCDPYVRFNPQTNFSAPSLTRMSHVTNRSGESVNLVSGASFNSGFGVDFGIMRGSIFEARVSTRPYSNLSSVVEDGWTLYTLHKRRAYDARTLRLELGGSSTITLLTACRASLDYLEFKRNH